MKAFIKILRFLTDLPVTLLFNLKYLGLGSLFILPIRISRKTKIVNLKGRIQIKGKLSGGMIKIGYSDVGIVDRRYERTIWDVRGTVVFCGSAQIGYGSKICVGPVGTLELGNDFVITASSTVVCFNHVSFGDGCLLSWEIQAMDTDFHNVIFDKSEKSGSGGSIIVGSKVWIGSRCTLLKGTQIPDNCVIGAGSLLNNKYLEGDSIIAGVPARMIKKIVGWEK